MKKNKVLMIFAMLIAIVMGVQSVDADTARYTVKRYDTTTGEELPASSHGNGVLVFSSQGMTGTCIQIGVHVDENGQGEAEFTEYSRNNLHAKVAYYWGVIKGYQDDVTKFKYKLFYRAMQYINDPDEVETHLQDNGWSSEHIQEMKDMVNYARDHVTVPTTFTIYKGDPSDGKQNFAVWKYTPPTVHKIYTPNSGFTTSKIVTVGQIIPYTITWSNNGYTDSTVTDTISAGLKFVSYPTDKCTLVNAQTIKCNMQEVNGSINITAQVLDAAKANASVCNNATAVIGGETITLEKLCNPVPSKDYSGTKESNPGFGHASVDYKIGQQIGYTIRYRNTSGTTQQVTIIDKLTGMKYVTDSTQGSIGNPTISSDGSTLTWPTQTLVNNELLTITYKAEVLPTAGYIVNNEPKVQIGQNPAMNINSLKNPVPKKEYDGTHNDRTRSTDAGYNAGYNHHEVLMPNERKHTDGDVIKYKITLPNVKSTEQDVTVIDVLSTGLTYTPGSVKVCYTNVDEECKTLAQMGDKMTESVLPTTAAATADSPEKSITTITWGIKVEPNKTATLRYSATVNEKAVNIVNNHATATYSNESSIFLAELENPVPRKQYDVDTANGMNGKIVQKDDIITYNISYANGFGSNATVNLRDRLSKGLTYEKGTALVCDVNKENCKKLADAGVTERVTILDDGRTEILWTRTNMPYEISNPNKIETIKYNVKVTGETIKVENDFDIKTCIDATQPPQPTYATIDHCMEYTNKNCKITCEEGDKDCIPATSKECVKQECTYTEMMCNQPWMDIEELKNPVPEKKYDDKTPSGFDQSAVAKGNIIRYEIRYTNVEKDPVTITIKDTISKGIEYRPGSSKINGEKIPDPKLSKDRKTLTWTRKNVGENVEESLTYEVVVTGETTEVINKACMIYSNNPKYERCLKRLKNPVPRKTYAKNTPKGANGAVVKKNDIIRYSIKYSNVKDQASSVIIMDHLSKGLKYQKGSAKVNGKKVQEISVTENSNGTVVVWMKEIAKKTKEELTYDVKVTGTKKLVENNASIQFDDDPMIKLDELRNPLLPGTQVIKVPNTASQLAIAGIVAGTVLVGAGGYLIYRRYKNV